MVENYLPLSKIIVFSDNLNYDKVAGIAEYCNNRISISFGVGTNFTNDVNLKPLNIVIKMTETCPLGEKWLPVIKLSDEPNKHTGNLETIHHAFEELG